MLVEEDDDKELCAVDSSSAKALICFGDRYSDGIATIGRTTPSMNTVIAAIAMIDTIARFTGIFISLYSRPVA